MRKVSCLLCVCLILFGLLTPVYGYTYGDTKEESNNSHISDNRENNKATEVYCFSDVHSNFWAYDAIMAMTKQGLFKGTTTPVNGIGTFAPQSSMTRAEFLTVVTRYLFADEVAAKEGNVVSKYNLWYYPYWLVAVEQGIIKNTDFESVYDMSKPITRQEMAYIMANVLKHLDTVPDGRISTSKIADYRNISSKYRDSVLICYSAGIIYGTDSKGTFAPKDYVTRAQGASVLYRLITPEVRRDIDLYSLNNSKSGRVISPQ